MEQIGFIGLGLIGGSIAASLRKSGKPYSMLAYAPPSDIGVAKAIEEHVIDSAVTKLEELCHCDIVFLCAPVLQNIQYLKPLTNILSSNCLITDVGSVKGNIQLEVDSLGLSDRFIGGHPMAGSEKTGYANASSRLFENVYYILTPTKNTPNKSLDRMTSLIQQLKAIPICIDPSEHDDITAAISHLPHIIAAELVNLVASSDSREQMKTLAAGGFKDITRIASSSPAIWQNICLSNSNGIQKSLSHFIASLQKILNAVVEKDASFLQQMFETACTFRDSIPNQTGIIKRIYELFLDIEDEAGAIAIIATLLGSQGISIKNIGIIHNREFEQGVLRIEFYQQNAMIQAKTVLEKRNYTIYERN